MTLPFDADDLNRRTPPQDCASMAEVRDGVDRLDRALIGLIAERTRYMDAAARIKPSRDVVRDEDRIEDVIAKVKAAAEAAPFQQVRVEILGVDKYAKR